MAEELSIDFVAAARFLSALGGHDGASFCFQTFDDSKQKREDLAAIRNGYFVAHQDELARLNQRGAGVFVTVNATDGRGRLIANVIGLRAAFVDGDGVPRPERWQVEPHIIAGTRIGCCGRGSRWSGLRRCSIVCG